MDYDDLVIRRATIKDAEQISALTDAALCAVASAGRLCAAPDNSKLRPSHCHARGCCIGR